MKISEEMVTVGSLKEKGDKKGGGVMIPYKKNDGIELSKQDNIMKDYTV